MVTRSNRSLSHGPGSSAQRTIMRSGSVTSPNRRHPSIVNPRAPEDTALLQSLMNAGSTKRVEFLA